MTIYKLAKQENDSYIAYKHAIVILWLSVILLVVYEMSEDNSYYYTYSKYR